jgi:hypothetical protein
VRKGEEDIFGKLLVEELFPRQILQDIMNGLEGSGNFSR